MILVDNSVYSFGFQLQNGIPITPYYDDKNDNELMYLAQYVLSIEAEEDVREKNASTFQLEEFKAACIYDASNGQIELNQMVFAAGLQQQIASSQSESPVLSEKYDNGE